MGSTPHNGSCDGSTAAGSCPPPWPCASSEIPRQDGHRRRRRSHDAPQRATHHSRIRCHDAREPEARASIFAELRHRLTSKDGVAYARKRIAERLGELARSETTERKKQTRRLAELKKQIAQLVDVLADGRKSAAILQRLEALENERGEVQRTLKTASRIGTAPIELPSPEVFLKLVFDLEARLMDDVPKGRELLRRLFRDGAITLVPKDGFYVATSEVLPLMLLTMPEQETTTPPRQGQGGGRFPQVSCAGRI